MAFRDPAQAAAFVDSVFSAGGASGKPRKHPSMWTAPYTLRVANRWQRDAAAGRPLTFQAGRGHISTPERPREFVIKPTGEGRTRAAVPSRQAGAGDLVQREYRDPAAMLRWAERTPGWPESTIQVTAFGVPKLDYSQISEQAFRAGGTIAEASAEERASEWRAVYTGIPGEEDFNGQTIATRHRDGSVTPDYAGLQRAVDRIFERGTVTRYTLRWHA